MGQAGKGQRRPSARTPGQANYSIDRRLAVHGCRFYGRYETPTPTRRPSTLPNNDTVLDACNLAVAAMKSYCRTAGKIIYEERWAWLRVATTGPAGSKLGDMQIN